MRNQNQKNLIMSFYENYKPLLRQSDKTDFFEWQKSARSKLRELLGLDIIPSCENDLKIINVTDCEDYTDTYFSFQSEPNYYVPCHMLKPKNISGNIPAIICLQGHSTGMHISIGVPKYDGDEEDISSGDRNYAQIAVRKGYCAIAIEQRYMGECGGTAEGTGCQLRPADSVNAMPALLFGRTAIGERVHDVIRIIDIITSNDSDMFSFIDSDDITVTGNSGGGTTTFYAACIEGRIKQAIPSCSVCTYKDSIVDLSHCGCNYIPSVARYFDMGDLAGLVAPRGLIIIAGKEDRIFPIDGVISTYNLAKSLYKKINADNKIDLKIGNGGHRYYADEAFEALEKMRKI